jgi:uncharacterized flavoprotein (TIGR03862 family)
MGGGPAGLIAAETLANAGVHVTVVEAMASVGRKFLLAGRGGLNITHGEPLPELLARYGHVPGPVAEAIRQFPPSALRGWCDGLGEPTFMGSSGRIFPTSFRATPLLRAWRARLDALGVEWRLRTRWTGWDRDGSLQLSDGSTLDVDATVLALGGASWPRTGSDAAWVPVLREAGIRVNPLQPANVGLTVAWSPTFANRFAGVPLKNVRIGCGPSSSRGEAMITATGIEGGGIYAIGAGARAALHRRGAADLTIDLQPDLDDAQFTARLASGRPGDSLSNRLRRAGLSPVAVALWRETRPPGATSAPSKHIAVRATGTQPIARAISTAGGIAAEEIDGAMMLRLLPGTFVAGEMLDWDAPTGGYLLQACFSTGVAAARGALARIR